MPVNNSCKELPPLPLSAQPMLSLPSYSYEQRSLIIIFSAALLYDECTMRSGGGILPPYLHAEICSQVCCTEVYTVYLSVSEGNHLCRLLKPRLVGNRLVLCKALPTNSSLSNPICHRSPGKLPSSCRWGAMGLTLPRGWRPHAGGVPGVQSPKLGLLMSTSHHLSSVKQLKQNCSVRCKCCRRYVHISHSRCIFSSECPKF